MELHGNLSPTLIQDFYLYSLTAILFKNNSLMIHEPIILSDDRNQSRAYIFIAGIE